MRRVGSASPWAPGPLAVLAGCLIPIVGVFAVDDLGVGLVTIAAQVLAFGWLLRDWRGAWLRAVFGLIAAAGIAVSTYLYAGRNLTEAATAAARIVTLVLPSVLLLGRLRPSELGDHLAQRLRLPARGVVASMAALQRLDAFGAEWQTIQRARRARGHGVEGGPVRRVREAGASAFALLVVSMRRTGVMAVAMDARGFASATDRTWAAPAPWHAVDSLVLMLAIAVALLPWLIR